jgi:bifunctional DNA primase/polymerase-like protein
MLQFTAEETLPPVDYRPDGDWLYGAAMFYASLDLPIVANQPGGKRVAWQVHGTDWSDWNAIALTTPEQVHRAWQKNPAFCPGLITGRISRILVIDGDVKSGQNPAKELQDWQDSTGITLPEGPIARTSSYENGHRGFHRFFTLPDDAPEIPTTQAWLPGVDIICEQRQVLLAPSWSDKRKINEARGEGLTDQQYMWQLPGFRYGLHTRDYYPSGEDLRESLEEAEAPAGLLEDILQYGGSRTEEQRLAEQKKSLRTGQKLDKTGVILTAEGLIDIDHYLAHGAPDKQNEILLRIATAMVGGYRKTPEEAVEVCWKFLQKCENTDPTWEWTRRDAETKVRQQKRYVDKKRADDRREKEEAELQLITELRARWAQNRGSKR